MFNYFTSKDEAVVWAALDVAERIVERFDAAPHGEPVTTSLRTAVATALRELTAAGPEAAVALSTVHRSAVLQPHWFAAMGEVQRPGPGRVPRTGPGPVNCHTGPLER